MRPRIMAFVLFVALVVAWHFFLVRRGSVSSAEPNPDSDKIRPAASNFHHASVGSWELAPLTGEKTLKLMEPFFSVGQPEISGYLIVTLRS